MLFPRKFWAKFLARLSLSYERAGSRQCRFYVRFYVDHGAFPRTESAGKPNVSCEYIASAIRDPRCLQPPFGECCKAISDRAPPRIHMQGTSHHLTFFRSSAVSVRLRAVLAMPPFIPNTSPQDCIYSRLAAMTPPSPPIFLPRGQQPRPSLVYYTLGLWIRS